MPHFGVNLSVPRRYRPYHGRYHQKNLKVKFDILKIKIGFKGNFSDKKNFLDEANCDGIRRLM